MIWGGLDATFSELGTSSLCVCFVVGGQIVTFVSMCSCVYMYVHVPMWPDVSLCLLLPMLAFETGPLIGLGLTNSFR